MIVTILAYLLAASPVSAHAEQAANEKATPLIAVEVFPYARISKIELWGDGRMLVRLAGSDSTYVRLDPRERALVHRWFMDNDIDILLDAEDDHACNDGTDISFCRGERCHLLSRCSSWLCDIHEMALDLLKLIDSFIIRHVGRQYSFNTDFCEVRESTSSWPTVNGARRSELRRRNARDLSSRLQLAPSVARALMPALLLDHVT